MKVLVVVDMQNDFISGALGTKEARGIVANVAEKIKGFDGIVLATRDTHKENYLETQEGRLLPVKHCVEGTFGHEICGEIGALLADEPIDKPTFGSVALGEKLLALNSESKIESVTFVGLCTDICVISNALVAKAFLPEVPIFVDAKCCAGVTPQSHERALLAMKSCQIGILNY